MNPIRTILLILSLCHIELPAADLPDGPIVPEGFEVDLVAREPHVRNPTVLAFDAAGRLFVGQGPQWRAPSPETPGDHVDLMIDEDGDGVTDYTKRFAEGFNSIQGLAWWGKDLWVANAPELTLVRDEDGDDVADTYVRLYTGLGNLEHSLHGLNVGPDGFMYMSKGNSRGYNTSERLAPLAFRELWGLPSPEGAPDIPPAVTFTADNYERSYHTPQDDWGQQGGILRCGPYGKGLEIVARGFRNPWDITFDDGFHWLGTDNDQVSGDRIIMPFHGAHFGWGHPWSFHWTGEGHLPTVPNSGPLFEGSGTGIIHYHADLFPEEYRGAYLICDWLRREVTLFQPQWKGAQQIANEWKTTVFAHAGGGRSMPMSSGRHFDPTDIEVGPDSALYVSSWGREYGATFEEGRQSNEGRIYRIRPSGGRPILLPKGDHLASRMKQVAFPLPALRVEAQEALLRMGEQAVTALQESLKAGDLSKAEETWFTWTLARMKVNQQQLDSFFVKLLQGEGTSLNLRIQCLRALGHRFRERGSDAILPNIVRSHLNHQEPRLRFEAAQAIWQTGARAASKELIGRAAVERDRLTFHVIWNSLRDILSEKERVDLLDHKEGQVRLAALLGLLEDDLLSSDAVRERTRDISPEVAGIAVSWLEKTGNAKEPLIVFDPPPGTYHEPIEIKLSSTIPGSRIHFTLSGDTPVMTSPVHRSPIPIDRSTTLKAIVSAGRLQQGRVMTGEYVIEPRPLFRQRAFVSDLRSASGRPYQFDATGLAIGKAHYTDRQYRIREVPAELDEVPFIRTANGDDRFRSTTVVSFTVDEPVTLYLGLDARIPEPPEWLKVGRKGGFTKTDLKIVTTDPVFNVFRKDFPAGVIELGSNLDRPSDSPRGHYIVALDRQLIHPQEKPASASEALGRMSGADPERGRELFLHSKGAGCFQCHALEGRGNVFAPDLSDIGDRANAETLIDSVLFPSRVITEGFAQQVVETRDDFTYSGIVVNESGRLLELAQASGQTIRIRKEDILKREATLLSAMPDGFASLMTAQQVADLTAYLLQQRKAPEGFHFRRTPTTLELKLGGHRLATYLLDHDQLTRRAFVNVHTPGGIQVTRNFPPRKPEDIDPGYRGEAGIIHPVMHPGLWMGFGWIEGQDYWRLQAKVVHRKFLKEPWTKGDQAGFSVLNDYLDRSGSRVICSEECHFVFHRIPEGWTLDWDSSFSSDEGDFRFGDQEESGLAIRMASPLRVQGGNGRILNDRGDLNGAGTWGKTMKWIDYSGITGNRRTGIRVIPHPENPRPSWSHSRDYGVVVINPFPKQPKERREPYVTTLVKKGETFRLRYRVVIYGIEEGKELESH